MSTQSEIAAAVGRWISLLELAVRNNPDGDIYSILARPDVSRQLERQLGKARTLAEAALAKAWPETGSPYRASLAADIARAYGTPASQLREAAVTAFQSVPRAAFVPGVTVPGVNPAMAAARLRAAAVVRATARIAWHLGLRNELTAVVGETRASGEKALAQAEPGWKKKWVSRQDNKVCEWCRLLNGLPAIPVNEEFSYGNVTGPRRPPRIYRDLLCPPAHPRCRCDIMLMRAGVPPSPPVVPGVHYPLFMTAREVRDIPDARYGALLEFSFAAVQELGGELSPSYEVGKAHG